MNKINKNKLLLDKAQYLDGDTIEVQLLLEDSQNKSLIFDDSAGDLNSNLVISVFKLHELIEFKQKIVSTESGFLIQLYGLEIGNYILSVNYKDELLETSFDIVNSSSDVIRYGFLTDFDGTDNSGDIEFMAAMHINTVQFYDWMYRHDQLVSEEDHYKDPLGRDTSNHVIREKIKLCNNKGMRGFAYGAVYAATKETFEKYPQWGLYTLDGEPMMFADWLYFMNIAVTSGWRKHIIKEYSNALQMLGFSGIHMDTYGFPKNTCDINGRRIDLADEFTGLIDDSRDAVCKLNSKNGVIFNAVNNWPIEAIAKSRQDAAYIEVWPPNDTYFDLYRLIRNGIHLCKKNVVLAAYMHPFQKIDTVEETQHAENSFLLTNAVINASGGTQLALGEEEGILCDSYYVKYAKLRPEFLPKVKKYCDFLVAYADLLYKDNGVDISMTASGGINEDICFYSKQASFSTDGKEGTIWTIIRQLSNRISIQLLNLTQNDNLWNTPKNNPLEITDLSVKIRFDRDFTHIYGASPDYESLLPVPLAYQVEKKNCGRIYTIQIPKLTIWNTVYIEME